MRRTPNESSLGERVVELARMSDGPRTLQLEQETALTLKRAITRLETLGIAVTVIGQRDTHPTLILKSKCETFARLSECVAVPIRNPRMVAGFETAYTHTLYEQWLLSNPKAVHIPKISARPWRDEQPATADMRVFYPYCELATREEVTLAPLTIRATNEPPKPAHSNPVKRYKTLAEAW